MHAGAQAEQDGGNLAHVYTDGRRQAETVGCTPLATERKERACPCPRESLQDSRRPSLSPERGAWISGSLDRSFGMGQSEFCCFQAKLSLALLPILRGLLPLLADRVRR